MSIGMPYIVAGPCSVEGREQIASVALALARLPQVSMVRCGVWKPRTRPGGFEGHGEVALQWIAECRAAVDAVREENGGGRLLFCCEVARPEHVETVLRYGIDAVWIGARSTASPFVVQELTEALRGTKLPVMVKNAPSPDVRLWMGAMERCRQVGVEDLKAVHRGFDVYRNDGYRNNPLWEIPIELRRLMPDVPILCDPSHIAGRREPLAALSQTAMDLGFDGLMIETHPKPEKALTDAGQQISPDELAALLAGLVMRSTDSRVADEELRLLREQIDYIDKDVLRLMSARFEVARQIARVKEEGNLAVFQPKRWDTVLRQRMEAAERQGVDPAFVKALFEKIHAESVRVQEQEIGKMNVDKK
jgi:chorismate mutase